MLQILYSRDKLCELHSGWSSAESNGACQVSLVENTCVAMKFLEKFPWKLVYNRTTCQFAIHITHTFLNNPENEYRITLVLCVESQISELILIKPIIYQLKLASNETGKFSRRGNRTKILERRWKIRSIENSQKIHKRRKRKRSIDKHVTQRTCSTN